MSWNWDTAPGARATRSAARKVLVSMIVGVLCLGAAWAGTGLAPVSSRKTDKLVGKNVIGSKSKGGAKTAVATEAVAVAEPSGSAPAGFTPADLQPGQILGGAAKVSLYPRPEDYQEQFPGARWERDQAKCETLTPSQAAVEGLAHVPDTRVRWAENPNCLYMGGYGIGPMNAIGSWDDEFGLWSRSVAMRDAAGDTVVLTLLDAVYWEAFYSNMCPTAEPCGFIDLADQLAAETGLPAASFVFASTHSHTAMDFIGGWGGVPKWYMQQTIDSMKTSVRDSIAAMEPAILETGEGILRERNGERRDFYRSAEDDTLSWFRLIDADNQPGPTTCTADFPPPPKFPNGGTRQQWVDWFKAMKNHKVQPVCTPGAPGRAIATVGAYAAHPVTEDEGPGQADADFPAVFAKRVEDKFGGVGMFLQTGLGNMSPRGDKIEMGEGLAGAIPNMGVGTKVSNADVSVGRAFWNQPATNVPLSGLGAAGFFDRKFNQTPASVSYGKDPGTPQNKRCNSASPLSVRTSVSAAKVGSLWITGAPGEVFANFTNTIEERNPNGVTLALGLVNDGLGYIIQSFETDHVGRQGTGFVGSPIAEYEDAYSIDHCFGDASLAETIGLLGRI